MARVLSGIQPSGTLHLGNYLGALRQWVIDQWEYDALFCVVDLHTLTLDIEPEKLRRGTWATAAGYIACGIDPEHTPVFAQSHVPEHTGLSWLLECTANVGELRRMTQFKDKGAQQESVRASLLTYPVLMAADILLYDAERVPVGDDQRQHLELARDLAIRFNSRYGETFVVPEAAIPTVAARVMDLQQPDRKMSKSVSSTLGMIDITDPPDDIIKKIRRAVTDAEKGVAYDPEKRPGVANLLEILAASSGGSPAALAEQYDSYGPLKADTADAVVELLRPVQSRLAEIEAESGLVEVALRSGAARAQEIASVTLARARDAIGLLAP